MSEVKEEEVQEEATEAKTEATEAKSDKVTVCANKDKYQKSRTAAGKPSMNCGDSVAEAFSGLSISQKYALASKVTGVDRKELEEKYSHLNVGMQGMSLANRVRGAINKDAKSEEPKGLEALMNKIVAPLQEEAKKSAEESAEKAEAEKAKKDTKAA